MLRSDFDTGYGDGGWSGDVAGGGGGEPYPLPRSGQSEKIELLSSSLGRPAAEAYGRHVVGGNVIYQQVNPDDTTTYIVGLGAGEWDAIEILWVNGVQWTLPDARAHFHPGLDGELGAETDPGTRNQKICSFYPASFTPRLTFSRIAYLALELPADIESPDGVLDVRGVYRAKRVRIFDSSGNQTAYEYSASPAWCILDLIYSRMINPHATVNQALTAAEKARFNFSSFAAAATYCAADPGDGAARFECHVALVDQVDMMRALDQLLLTCRGYLIDRGGEISLYVDQARSSQFTATRYAIAESPRMSFPKKDLRGLANKFRIKYRALDSGDGEPANDFQIVTDDVEDHDHQDRVSKVIPAEFDLGNTTPGRAKRIGEYLRDRSLLLTEQINMGLLQCGDSVNPIDLLPGDLITAPSDIDGWSTRDYEVLEITDDPDGGRQVFAQEYSADVFHETTSSPKVIFPTDVNEDTAEPTIPTSIGANLAVSANGLELLFGVIAEANARTVVEAKLRVKRASDDDPNPSTLDLRNTAEGGSDTDLLQYDNLHADRFGMSLPITVSRPGRYFFAWALRNIAGGWSGWTDGSDYEDGPASVPLAHSIVTTDTADTGPATGWTPHLLDHADDSKIAINEVQVQCSRPTGNGNNLLRWAWQIANTAHAEWPGWLPADTTTLPGVVRYDGSAISHLLVDGGLIIRRASGTGFGSTAVIGDLVLLDVRGGAFHVNYCQWGTIVEFQDASGNPTTNALAVQIMIQGKFHPRVSTDLRMKIVLPVWGWSTKGYIPNPVGYADAWIQGSPEAVFYSPRINLGNAAYTGLDCRVWFENHYCTSDSTSAGGAPTYSSDAAATNEDMVTAKDTVLPGAVQNFAMTGSEGRFYASWDAPATGYNTIDNYLIQASPNSDFSSPRYTVDLGVRLSVDGEDPGQTLYWRIAARNRSGLASHASGPGAAGGYKAGETGWNQWVNYGSPSAVSSGQLGVHTVDGVVRSQNGFRETFEALPSGWTIFSEASGATRVLQTGIGETGGNAIRVTRGYGEFSPAKIPFDPSKLYRIRARVRRHATVSAEHRVYIGVAAFQADGSTYQNHDDGYPWYYLGGYVDLTPYAIDEWVVMTRWFMGVSDTSSSGSSSDPTAPYPLHTGTKYISILYLSCYTSTNNDVTDIDEISIDVIDEDVADRTYRGLLPGGANLKSDGGWRETFEVMPDWRIVTAYGSPTGTQSIVSGQGQSGGKVYRSTGYIWLVSNDRIPYDASKLYRMRARVRRQSPGTGGVIYAGVCGYRADGTTRCAVDGADGDGSQHYICASAVTPNDGVWTEYTGWFKGWAATGDTTPSTDPTDPQVLNQYVRYMSPLFILNYSSGTETVDIDEIAIDVIEEGPGLRTLTGTTNYQAASAPNGSFSGGTLAHTERADGSTDLVISFSFNQSTVPATGFLVFFKVGASAPGTPTITDAAWAIDARPGNANYEVRVSGVNPSSYYSFGICAFSVNKDGRTLTSIYTPAAIVDERPAAQPNYTGNINGTIASTVTTGAANGQTAFTDTAQWRNNTAPTNGISTLNGSAGWTPGANQATVELDLPSYSQGANIATHLAVLVKSGGGTISLTADCIIALLNLASLPDTYKIPFPFNQSSVFSIGLASVALTKAGFTFNGTFAQWTLDLTGDMYIVTGSGDDIHIQATGGTLSIENCDITMSSGRTVDGVDVGAHAAATDAHSATGGIPGLNKANTPGSSFRLICQSNGRIGPRYGTHATNWPTTADCTDGEMLLWWNQAVGIRLYVRNDSNMHYVNMST